MTECDFCNQPKTVLHITDHGRTIALCQKHANNLNGKLDPIPPALFLIATAVAVYLMIEILT